MTTTPIADPTAARALWLGGPQLVPLGVGTWAWGDRWTWGYGRTFDGADILGAFWTSVNGGVGFFDTAELYGGGTSEQILGRVVAGCQAPLAIATKYFPYPWRLQPADVRAALVGSLRRLGRTRVALYQIHWPFGVLAIPQLMDALADLVADGLTEAVGVSNYSAEQTQRAHAALARRGVPLATNQVEYSLVARGVEQDGTRAACEQLGVTLIGYSPLAQGVLTGKYGPGTLPSGLRQLGRHFRPGKLTALMPILALMRQIGALHGGRTPSQVALNWQICKGAVPIPGAKSARQALDNLGALGWSLTEDDIERLDYATRSYEV